MIEWFNLMFAEPDEQAKLFTVVLSTAVAVFIVLLNQSFISRRTKKERLIGKLEELTAAVHGAAASGHKACKSLLVEHVNDDDSIDELKKNMWKITTLCSLYFQKHSISNNSLVDAIDMIMFARDILNNKENRPEDKVNELDVHTSIMKKLNDWFGDSTTILNELTKKHIK